MQQPGFTLAHIGINPDGADAAAIADRFCSAFGYARKDGASSVFAGSVVEVMRENYLGAKGHIAFGAPDVNAAVQWLEARGFAVDPATAKYDKDGSLKAIYLTEAFGGFAIHLLKR